LPTLEHTNQVHGANPRICSSGQLTATACWVTQQERLSGWVCRLANAVPQAGQVHERHSQPEHQHFLFTTLNEHRGSILNFRHPHTRPHGVMLSITRLFKRMATPHGQKLKLRMMINKPNSKPVPDKKWTGGKAPLILHFGIRCWEVCLIPQTLYHWGNRLPPG